MKPFAVIAYHTTSLGESHSFSGIPLDFSVPIFEFCASLLFQSDKKQPRRWAECRWGCSAVATGKPGGHAPLTIGCVSIFSLLQQMFSFRLFIEDVKGAKWVWEIGKKVLIRVKVCKVSACLLAALHLQHMLQAGLWVNDNLLMLIVWELTARCKLGCMLNPVSMFEAKKRCFNAAWYQRWDWLKYSVKFEAAFCFPCCNFESKAEEDF